MSRSKKKYSHKNKYPKRKNYPADFIAEAQIDFHEFGVLTQFDIEKYLVEFIEDSHIAGLTQVLVITGKGSVVRPTVRQLLRNNPLVETFRTAGYFNGQDGAMEVTICKDS